MPELECYFIDCNLMYLRYVLTLFTDYLLDVMSCP